MKQPNQTLLEVSAPFGPKGADRRRQPKPAWLKAAIPSGDDYFKIKKNLEKRKLFTICQNARCPNISECWNNHHATFLIMGDTCSRNCTFCSVKAGVPGPLLAEEAERVLEMVQILDAAYVVITSVTRDDLEDGGSGHFAQVISYLKEHRPGVKVEALIPDFKGNVRHLDTVLAARPDVLNHNLETVERLYPHVNRPIGNYRVSLGVLLKAHHRKETTAGTEGTESTERSSNSSAAGEAAVKPLVTKSGIMVGLGETLDELKELFRDLRESGVDLLTIGQYLQPTTANVPVEKFYTPEEFAELKEIALAAGFRAVESGPFVRSSYQAQSMYDSCQT